MLTDYINTAMRHTVCEFLDDDASYCEIPELPGVRGNAATEGEARAELQSVFKAWIALGLARNQPLPAIDGVEIAVEGVRWRLRSVS